MYLVRDVLNTKPGKAKELVAKFKSAAPSMEKAGYRNLKIMTDIVADYWTVVLQYEMEDLSDFANRMRTATGEKEVQNIMKGYMELLNGGRREIFLIE